MGYDSSDDACIYQLNDEMALVQTVDFFPPMVDDPFLFGQIAAANALSDVYAMGGRPTHAMNLLCFPNCLDLQIAGEILKGGADKANEAGCVIAGGHSITDNEPKYGMCVSGLVHPSRILMNNGGKLGDMLILTKAVGTGVITTAVKGELLGNEDLMIAVDSMRTLNKRAAEIAQDFTIHACTDVTGFGVAGHVCEMVEGTGLTSQLHASALPLLPHAQEMAEMGIIPAGAYRNRDYFHNRIQFAADVPIALSDLLFDPQTSGGLLFAVAADEGDALLQALRKEIPTAAIIGRMIAAADTDVQVIL